MSDTEKKTEQAKGDAILRRMLKTPPKPKVNPVVTEPDTDKKPSDTPAKKRRSEKS